MAPSRHDWKIVDWDVKPQHNQKPLLPHYITLPFPTPFPTLSSHLLYSPTIPSPPFNPQLTYPTLQSPTPMPLISSLGYPTLLSHPYPTIFSPLLPFPRIPSPTYLPYLTPLSYSCIPYPLLPLIPYPTITLRTLSPLPYYTLPSTTLPSHPLPSYPRTPIPILCSPHLSSPTLPCPLPYHIPPDRSRGLNVSFPTSLGYLNPFLLYPPLPFHPSTLASHPLRSSPLP